ncbi:DUF6093 family protein [Embleya sp. NPDC059237]|uniref:DUF6093 family protein n=1 Tax=Embleya sp. NPDC059237 TaxID=3346784 RepID=UPI0036CAB539
MPVDLDRVAAAVDHAVLLDRVRIERASIEAAYTLDPQTGRLISTPPTLVHDGPGLVSRHSGAPPTTLLEGAIRLPDSQDWYQLLLSKSAPAVREADELTVLISRDVQLLNLRFRIAGSDVGTMLVVRTVWMTRMRTTT